jgi:signal transduction histidine kinase
MTIENAYDHPDFSPEVDRLTGYRTNSLIAVPLRSNRGEIIGVVQALNRLDGNAFDGKDLSILEAMASQVSAAIEIAGLYGKMVKHNLELDTLYDIEREINWAQDPEQVVERVLAKAMTIIRSEAGSILLQSRKDRGRLYFQTALGEQGNRLKGYSVDTGRGIVGWVAQHGRTARVNNVRSDKRFDPNLARMLGYPTRQILAAPLEIDGTVIGAVELVNRSDGGSFTEENERLLRLIATQIARAVRVSQEIHERKQQERLASIGSMLSGLLHDLKTPITVVTACSEFLIDESSREKRKDMCERILRQLDTLNRMTRDIMAFARGESTVLIRKVYMNLFLDELEELIGAESEGTPVDVSWKRSYEGLAHFDQHSIRRALLNMARNAIQAMPEGGRLEISVDVEGERLVFNVTDNGPGIPEEIREDLFGTFVTSGKKDGTGLGLAIVKQAVEGHRGTIDVETSGAGTTFTIRLPLNPEAEAEEAQTSATGVTLIP